MILLINTMDILYNVVITGESGIMMHYKTYLFDFDYTLADATNGIVESANHALSGMNFPLPPRDEIRRTVGMSLSESFTYLTNNEEPGLKSMYTKLFKEKADEVMTQNTQLFQETNLVLSYLKSRGNQTGIVTTKYRYRIVEVLEKYRMAHLIDVIVGGDDVKNPKPDPEALNRAIRLLDTAKDNVVYIGDSIIDAKTANSANVDFIAVTTGTTTKDEFMQLPHVSIISSLTGLVSDETMSGGCHGKSII